MNQSERVNLNSPTIPAFFVRWVIPRKVRRQLYESGIGRHTADEIWHIGRQNVDALSTFIGTRFFFRIKVPSHGAATVAVTRNVNNWIPL